jgi:hypothetical protein
MNSKHGDGIIAHLIIYSDQTSLSKNGIISRHHIYFTLANIACEDRYLSESHYLDVLPDFSTLKYKFH